MNKYILYRIGVVEEDDEDRDEVEAEEMVAITQWKSEDLAMPCWTTSSEPFGMTFLKCLNMRNARWTPMAPTLRIAAATPTT